MTLTGHTATSGAAGYMVYRLTGSMTLGHATAFLLHIPADLLINEFWQWGGPGIKTKWFTITRDHIRLVLYEIPAGALLIYSAIYVDPRALIFGLVGNGPDLIDLVRTQLHKAPIFPCHPGSKPLHFEPFFAMLSLKATAIVDTLMTLGYFGILLMLNR